LSGEPDQLVWKLHASGEYTSQSLYVVVNFRGVKPVFTPSVWKLNVPPRVHVFIWLVSDNKILTRDDLSKRQLVQDKRCLFCSDLESVEHLCFECDIIKMVWNCVSIIMKKQVGSTYEQVAGLWVSNEANGAVNIITSVVILNAWKMRNEFFLVD
jgi:hypothetical protein